MPPCIRLLSSDEVCKPAARDPVRFAPQGVSLSSHKFVQLSGPTAADRAGCPRHDRSGRGGHHLVSTVMEGVLDRREKAGTLSVCTACARDVAQAFRCDRWSGEWTTSSSVRGAYLPPARAACARQRAGAAPGACTQALGKRWSPRKAAGGGSARTLRSARVPQAASLVPGAIAQGHRLAIGLQESPAAHTVGKVPCKGMPRLGIQGIIHVREDEVRHLPTAEHPREAHGSRSVSPAVVNHAWSVASSRVLYVMMPCASVPQKSPPGPAAAPGAPGAGGFSPCPYAPVTSADCAYSPELCPVRQGGQEGCTQAPRPLDQSHDCANGCDARVLW